MQIGFTQKAQHTLRRAQELAGERGHTVIGTEHLLLSLLEEKDGVAAHVLEERGVFFDKVDRMMEDSVGCGIPGALSAEDMTPRMKKIIEVSGTSAIRMKSKYIGTEHLLLALCEETECFAWRLMTEAGAAVSEIRRDVLAYFGEEAERTGADDSRTDPGHAGNSHAAGRGKKQDGIRTSPVLEQYSRNLCRMAQEGKLDPIIGRETETDRVMQILSRRTKNNPCLIGEPGVGKTAVAEGLAQRMAEGNVPAPLDGKTLLLLDLSSMIAGAKYRGEFEERMKSVLDEVRRCPQIILFIDEIHTLVGAGGAEGAVDAANILKPALARGEIQVIGATTREEYRRHIEKDAALERRFQPVLVGEPTPEEAEKIIIGLRDKYEAHHGLKISDEAVRAAVALSVRYIGDRYLPDKAIDLMDEAASKKRMQAFRTPPDIRAAEEKLRCARAEKEEAILGEDYETAARLRDEEKQLAEQLREKKDGGNHPEQLPVIREADIADIVTEWTHIPVRERTKEEENGLLHLEERLRERIVGQDAAVEAVARAVRRGRMGMKDPRRPIGSFLFLGPTGVGKTELCRVLAETVFGTADAVIRLDMSEYMEKHSISRLLGSPPGYVGYEEGGQLTEKIRRQPYAVVLFDEIEKAHPDVWNLLLQIFEDGILTDAQGRRADFKNCILIMTSNIGAGSMTEPKPLGFLDAVRDGGERMRADVMEALRHTFRPEFLNRVDETVLFSRLSASSMEKITAVLLRDVQNRAGQRGITLTFSPESVTCLAQKGFDPVYGARPLRRTIVRLVEDPLSDALLGGEIARGDTVQAVCTDDGAGLVFRKQATEESI